MRDTPAQQGVPAPLARAWIAGLSLPVPAASAFKGVTVLPKNPMNDQLIRVDALTKIVRSGEEPLTILDEVSFDVAPGASIDRKSVV